MEEQERLKHTLSRGLEAVEEVLVAQNWWALEEAVVEGEQPRQKVVEEVVLREDQSLHSAVGLSVTAVGVEGGWIVLEVEVARCLLLGLGELVENSMVVMAEPLNLAHWVFWVAEAVERHWMEEQHMNRMKVDLELEYLELEAAVGPVREPALEEAPAPFVP